MSRADIVPATIAAIFIAFMAFCFYKIATEPEMPCVDHVPRSNVTEPSWQCMRGASLQVVDRVALCVCQKGAP